MEASDLPLLFELFEAAPRQGPGSAALGADYDLVWAEGSAYTIGFETALHIRL